MPSWPLPASAPALYPNDIGGLTPPKLENWQFSYGVKESTQIVMGPGTPYGIKTVEGLSALPTVNNQDMAFPRDHGEYAGTDSMGGRDITMDLFISGDNTTILQAAETIARVSQTGAVINMPLWFQLPGYELLCTMIRTRGRTSTIDALWAAGAAYEPTLNLHANDPRIYGAGQIAVSNAFDAASGVIPVKNGGNYETRPIIVINGGGAGKTGPVIANASIPSSPALVFGSTVNVKAGDSLIIDMGNPHTVIYWPGGYNNPTATPYNVFNWLDMASTAWWTLNPGVNNIEVSVASGTSLDHGGFEVWWADGWLW